MEDSSTTDWRNDLILLWTEPEMDVVSEWKIVTKGSDRRPLPVNGRWIQLTGRLEDECSLTQEVLELLANKRWPAGAGRELARVLLFVEFGIKC